MQKGNKLTVWRWCDQWFISNRSKWNGNTESGYRNLIYSHIYPSIGSVELEELTEQTVTDFYNKLLSQGLSARSIWCIHLLLRRCLDEAARDHLIPYNTVLLCPEPQSEEYKSVPLRLGQIQRYDTPSACYTVSSRAMPHKIEEPSYDRDVKVYRVGVKGTTRVNGKEYYIGTPMAEHFVAVEELVEHCIRFRFGNYEIAKFNLIDDCSSSRKIYRL